MNKSYKKPKTPYIILIALFFLLAAFDSMYINSADEQIVKVKVDKDSTSEVVESNGYFIAKHLIYLQNNE